MVRAENLVGLKFGRLTVIDRAEKPKKVKNTYAYWLCKCDCGEAVVVSSRGLKRGHTRSCGCLLKEIRTTHGMSKSALYNRWNEMRQRCNNSKDTSFPNYGARGICVCLEWDGNFQNFHDWAMNNGFSPDLQIDRIDTDGNYEPANCRWISCQRNGRNKRNNVKATIGSETKTIVEWAELSGIQYKTLLARFRQGWQEERLLLPIKETK